MNTFPKIHQLSKKIGLLAIYNYYDLEFKKISPILKKTKTQKLTVSKMFKISQLSLLQALMPFLCVLANEVS